MHFKSKKAVSPLIAAVLLIVVTVGIGAVVTGIIRGYVTENKQTIQKTATDLQCTNDVQINVPTYRDAYRICYNTTFTRINFTLENTGSMAVDDIQVKFFGTNGFSGVDSVMPSGLRSGQTNFSLNATYNSTIGTLQEVHIVPRKKVTGESNKLFCEEAKLKFSVSDMTTC